jgi:hypothetical protein
MKEIFRNSYMTIHFDEVKCLFVHTWKKTTEDMTDDDYKREMTLLFRKQGEVKPDLALYDSRLFYFTISPTLQLWSSTVNPPENNARKNAVVVSEDLFSQISIEQTLDEAQAVTPINIRYFTSIEEAEAWLFV